MRVLHDRLSLALRDGFILLATWPVYAQMLRDSRRMVARRRLVRPI